SPEDVVVEAYGDSAERPEPRLDDEFVVESGRAAEFQLCLDHRHVQASLHQPAIIGAPATQVFDAPGFGVRQISRMMDDTHEVRLEKAHPHGQSGDAMTRERLRFQCAPTGASSAP